MKNKDVSIIIPVYNADNYLERCINSVRSEKSLDIEIILIDDGSTDKSPSICQSYSEVDSRIKLIKKSNEGQGVARNIGIAASNAKYLYFVDSDDYISNNFLKDLFTASEKYNLDICMPKTMPDQYDKALEFITCVQAGRQFVKSSLIKDNGIWQPNSRSGQDGVFIHLALALCNKLGVVPSAQYFYVARDDGTFKTFSKMHDKSFALIQEHYNHIFYYYTTKGLWNTNALRLAHFFEDETLKFRVLPHFEHIDYRAQVGVCEFLSEKLKYITKYLSKNELDTLSTLTLNILNSNSPESCVNILKSTEFTKKKLPKKKTITDDNVILCEYSDCKYYESRGNVKSSLPQSFQIIANIFHRR